MVLLLISEGVSPKFAQQKNILLLYPSISYFRMKLASFWLTDLLKERLEECGTSQASLEEMGMWRD